MAAQRKWFTIVINGQKVRVTKVEYTRKSKAHPKGKKYSMYKDVHGKTYPKKSGYLAPLQRFNEIQKSLGKYVKDNDIDVGTVDGKSKFMALAKLISKHTKKYPTEEVTSEIGEWYNFAESVTTASPAKEWDNMPFDFDAIKGSPYQDYYDMIFTELLSILTQDPVFDDKIIHINIDALRDPMQNPPMEHSDMEDYEGDNSPPPLTEWYMESNIFYYLRHAFKYPPKFSVVGFDEKNVYWKLNLSGLFDDEFFDDYIKTEEEDKPQITPPETKAEKEKREKEEKEEKKKGKEPKTEGKSAKERELDKQIELEKLKAENRKAKDDMTRYLISQGWTAQQIEDYFKNV